jgi:hypothetical protein
MSRCAALVALILLSGALAACAVDEDDDTGATDQICTALDDASMVSPDQVGAADALAAASSGAPTEVRAALTTLTATAREIQALDPAAPDTANQVALILTDPAVGSAQSTVRSWLAANCAGD